MCIIILVSFIHFWKEKSHLLGHWPCYCIVRTLWHLSQTSLYLYFQYKQSYRKFQAILSLSVLQGGHHTRDDTRASGKAVSPRLSSLNWLFYGWGLGALWWVTLTNWRDIQRELSNWDFFRVYLFDLSYCTVRISYLPDDFQHFTVKITFEPTNYLALSSWPPKMHGIEIFSKL